MYEEIISFIKLYRNDLQADTIIDILRNLSFGGLISDHKLYDIVKMLKVNYSYGECNSVLYNKLTEEFC